MTLFGILKELHAQGVLGTQEIVRPSFGIGEIYTLDGQPLKICTNVIGDASHFAPNSEAYFNLPHDIAVKADGTIFAQALN